MRRDRYPPTGPFAAFGAGSPGPGSLRPDRRPVRARWRAARAVAGGIVSTMATDRTPPTAQAEGSTAVLEGAPGGAVFVDLDRTLLRGASGLVLSAAMHAEGLFDGRPSLPGERVFYGFYDMWGETLPFMAMVRAAARFVRGWPVEDVRRAGALAAPELAELVQPYAPAVLAGHRAAGRPLVLATTTPVDLIGPFAELFGFDHVVATRYAQSAGRYTGRIDGEFVWSVGKLAAARRFAAAHAVELGHSYAYSDSFFDLPLLRAVGHPRPVNPDRRLRLAARVHRWPVERWDRPPGVPAVAGFEPYDVLRHFVRPELFPYARFDIAGLGAVPTRGPVLLAANHRSYFDVAALAIVAARIGRPVRFLGKKEIFDTPLIGPLARALGGISVDRGDRPEQSLREARRALEAGEIVVILPQGTIPRGRAFFDPVLQGKTGAARLAAMTGAPVVPVGLWGTDRVWPRSERAPDLTGLWHPPAVRVRVGSPVVLDLDDARADTESIMAAIAALLPEEAHRAHDPTPDERARTFPPGRSGS
jgi:putative phosphoserine phosphatase / 1-acylglycerol-3-phosphate O-acyltransferase